jgi:multidrug transporter EmrE-like cation transporter
MGLYLLLAVLASALMAAGLVLMKSRAAALPKASGTGTPGAVLAWIRDPIWLVGVGLQTLGYAAYIVAVSRAPVSMVAVMMEGGIAMFVIFAVTFLGERASPREWLGIAAIVIAITLLGLSLPAGETSGAPGTVRLAEITVAILIISILPMTAGRWRESGTAAAVVSGFAFGLGSLYAKAMTDYYIAEPAVEMALRILTDPYVYFTIAANITGMILLQNSFHSARGIVALPISSALSNLIPIAGGMIAFGESLPADHAAAALRIGAFALTVISSLLLAGAEGAGAVHVASTS